MTAPTPLPWFDLSFPDVAANLAGDEAILVAAEEDLAPPVLRFWELDHPAVILGASCRLLENVRVDACRHDEVPIARRSSGGGTVVIGPGALNVSLVLPIASEPAAFRSVDTAQRLVLEQVAAALRWEGPEVAMLGSGDLTLGGRKFAGSAQRRLRHHLMIHFSILYRFDLASIDRYTQIPPRQPDYRANRSHDDFVVNLPLDRPTIVRAIRTIWASGSNQPGDYPVPHNLIAALATQKFRNPGWIERL